MAPSKKQSQSYQIHERKISIPKDNEIEIMQNNGWIYNSDVPAFTKLNSNHADINDGNSTIEAIIQPENWQWRLFRPNKTNKNNQDYKPVFESDSVQECIQANDCINRWNENYIKWSKDFPEQDYSKRPKILEKKKSSQVDNVLLVAMANDGECGIKVVVSDDKKTVGEFLAYYTNFEGEYILGKPSVRIDSFLNEQYKNRGLAREVYDFIEKLSKLPVVPSGHNGVEGSTSKDADLFWKKRAQKTTVLGLNEEETLKRKIKLNQATQIIRAENFPYDTESSIAIALATEWQIEAFKITSYLLDSNQEDVELVRTANAWCVTDQYQTLFGNKGFFLKSKAMETVFDLVKNGQSSQFKTISANQALVQYCAETYLERIYKEKDKIQDHGENRSDDNFEPTNVRNVCEEILTNVEKKWQVSRMILARHTGNLYAEDLKLPKLLALKIAVDKFIIDQNQTINHEQNLNNTL